MSLGLLLKCYEKGNEVVRANALFLPFRDNYFEGVISIAVLHHIATKVCPFVLLPIYVFLGYMFYLCSSILYRRDV